MSLALWLRAGRAQRGMTLEDVAKITKIQPRILERLEAGKLEGLPAEVFVRGFVRSFARCVGLTEGEALERYNQIAASTGSMLPPSAQARALVDSMSDLAPRAASRIVGGSAGPVMLVQAPTGLVPTLAEMVETVPASSMDAVKVEEIVAAAAPVIEPEPEPEAAPAIEVVETVEAAPKGKKKRKPRASKRKSIATGTPFEATPVVAAPLDDVAVAAPAAPVDVERPIISDAAPVVFAAIDSSIQTVGEPDQSVDIVIDVPVVVIDAEPAATEMWSPKMPPLATTSVPWRRPTLSASAAPMVPSLVIDDAAPEYAERVLEDRAASKVSTTNAQRRSFLPPILLDREDRSARQGGLTLAVILLLIAATITLSYLMRRPSSSGDGITQHDVQTLPIG